MDYSPLIMFAAMIAVALIAMYVRYVLAQQRYREWCRIASALGLQMAPPQSLSPLSFLAWGSAEEHAVMLASYRHELLHRGHAQRAPNLMTGRYAGRSLMCFDFQYTTGSGKNSHTYYWLCVLISAPFPCMELHVRPEGMGDHVMGFLGARDIQFESDEFNRRYHVECHQPRFAFDILHPRAMELLMQEDWMAFESSGMDLLFYQTRSQESWHSLEHNIRHLLDFSRRFMDLLPQYLSGPPAPRSDTRP